MQIVVCVDEDSEVEVRRVVAARARLLRTLDASVVERMLLTGEATRLIIDPSCASGEFFNVIAPVIIRSECRVLLWTQLTPRHVAAILRANRIPYADVLLRSREDHAVLLREYITNGEPLTVRATLLRRLAPTLRQLPSTLATDILRVLLRENLRLPIGQLLHALGISRRNFERALRCANICTINTFMHLGRILSAYDYVARAAGGVEAAAIAAGYPAGRDLAKNCRKFIGCRPSEFVSVISTRGVADRVVEAIVTPRPRVHQIV